MPGNEASVYSHASAVKLMGDYIHILPYLHSQASSTQYEKHSHIIMREPCKIVIYGVPTLLRAVKWHDIRQAFVHFRNSAG